MTTSAVVNQPLAGSAVYTQGRMAAFDSEIFILHRVIRLGFAEPRGCGVG